MPEHALFGIKLLRLRFPGVCSQVVVHVVQVVAEHGDGVVVGPVQLGDLVEHSVEHLLGAVGLARPRRTVRDVHDVLWGHFVKVRTDHHLGLGIKDAIRVGGVPVVLHEEELFVRHGHRRERRLHPVLFLGFPDHLREVNTVAVEPHPRQRERWVGFFGGPVCAADGREHLAVHGVE